MAERSIPSTSKLGRQSLLDLSEFALPSICSNSEQSKVDLETFDESWTLVGIDGSGGSNGDAGRLAVESRDL